MHFRSLTGRLFQTLFFEALGLALVVPVYSLAFGLAGREALAIMLAVSVTAMIWTALHHVLFDWFDWHLTRRLDGHRPIGLRVIQAVSQEVTSLSITLPMLIWLGGHSPREALATSLALAVFYTVYAFLFHVAADRWRPLGRHLAWT
ncbi:hypothetical protein LAZ40_23595 [Cereibacter sphaeroides]|uniref:chlorhexidine efflux transporter n=1 Tax=Rhodobacterales TaxID=204455 RepID=UPI000BBE8247|nr:MULTISPECIES: chlorhexidine efflux transporter [Paracoccaceae]MCE6952876.1 hypothetical protein [Cereibacter sphaeroides]MCE6962026.1 hypothetical protein [Cereibacter sphaeroides]MCE6970801.1 hypothetical protein [Cereibacter sphaeroides]MCE6975603.1 hypothetical protein [Cereibacter sphaeroides]